MNKVILTGRLTADPETKFTAGENQAAITRYRLAVDRKFKREGEENADFINCVTFGKSAEFAAKFLHKGIKIAVTGRLQTGSYTKEDGTKVFTTDVIVEEHEFCERKQAEAENPDATYVPPAYAPAPQASDFEDVPQDDDLPF